jgi:hypothetical protein
MKRTTMQTGARAVRNGSKAAAMAAEVPAAAFITIAHRLPMIFAAAIEPEARNNPELKRMVAEKAKAAAQSAGAVGRGATKAGDAVSRHWQEQARAGARLASRPLASAMAFQLMWRQAQSSVGASAALTATLADLAATTAAHALSPAHRAVAANAKRLSARKKRPAARQRKTGKA